MKKNTILFLAFAMMMALSAAATKQLIAQDFTIKKGAQMPKVTTYTNTEWLNARKFGISGWFKINQIIYSEIPIMSLNFDQPSTWSYGNAQHKFTIQDNAFVFYTYNKQNWEPNQYIGRVAFDTKDFGQWIFIYQAFDMDKQTTVTYVKSPNREQKILTKKPLSHVEAAKASLVLGSNSWLQDSDQIDMKNITVMYGEDAYIESGFEALMSDKSQVDNCSHLYAECGFKGEVSNHCNQNPSSGNSGFKSIYVAPGAGSFIIALPASRGSKPLIIRFLKSVECVDHTKYFEYATKGILEIFSVPETVKP